MQFPNLITLNKIYSCLPITSVSCERGLSAMNNIKTLKKTKMKVENLNDYMIKLNGLTFKDLLKRYFSQET